ncbi:MAG: peptidylprolyl isomerase [Actinobacteria bacterium]|nr:peptidylprolyl isomerase [Actinomycetota bacterium]
MGRQAQETAAKRQKTTKTTVRIVGAIVIILALFFGIAFLTKDDSTDNASPVTTTVDPFTSTTIAAGDATTTVPGDTAAPSDFAYGTTECPPVEGATIQTQTFSDSFALCIDPTKTYTAVVQTNMGTYSAVLDAAKAPGTVNNFVSLARNKYFDGTTCHRAIPGFMIQCGDPTATGNGGPGYKFADELPASGEYKIGSLAMANSGANTNGSQFFVISGDQGVSLPPNYTLFGQVTDGLDTTVVALDAAGNDDPSSNGVPPLKEIKIESITITES